MNLAQTLDFRATVQHTLIRADGSREVHLPDTRFIRRPNRYLHNLWLQLREAIPFFAGMSFLAFLDWQHVHPQRGLELVKLVQGLPLVGLVTTAGINYLATTFTSASNPLTNIKYHSYGTGDVHGATSTPTAATAATPSVFTQAAHGFTSGDIIKVTGITGITGVNGIWQIAVLSSSTYSLLGSVGGGSSFGGGTNAVQLLVGAADTALTTEVSGLTRVAGTPTNPTGQYVSTVTSQPFTGTTPPLTIVEWGIFSALTTGTLWDRRWLNTTNSPSTPGAAALVAAPITITAVGDSINTTYTLTCVAGGS